jgi:hypothetical protein
MDDRANYFRLLQEFSLKHKLEELPNRHQSRLSLAVDEKNWRDDEKVLSILQKASKKMVKNEKKLNKKI